MVPEEEDSDNDSVCFIEPPPKPPVLTITIFDEEDTQTKVHNEIQKNGKRNGDQEKEQPKEKNKRVEQHNKSSQSQKTTKKKRLHKKSKRVNLDDLFKPDVVLPSPRLVPTPIIHHPPKTTTTPIYTAPNDNNNGTNTDNTEVNDYNATNTNNTEANKSTSLSSLLSSSLPTSVSLSELSEADLEHLKFLQELNITAKIGLSLEETFELAQIDLPHQTTTKKKTTPQQQDSVQKQPSASNSKSTSKNKSKSSSTNNTNSTSSISKSTASSSRFSGSKSSTSKVVKETLNNQQAINSFKNANHHQDISSSRNEKELQANTEIFNPERINVAVNSNNNNGKSNNSNMTSHKALSYLQKTSAMMSNSTNEIQPASKITNSIAQTSTLTQPVKEIAQNNSAKVNNITAPCSSSLYSSSTLTLPTSKNTNSIAQTSTLTQSVKETTHNNSQKSNNTTASCPSSSYSSSTLPSKTVPIKSSVLLPCSKEILFLCPKKVWNYKKCRDMLEYFQKLEKELSIKIQRHINETEGKGIITLSGISFVGILQAKSKISEWLEIHNLDEPNRGPLMKSSSTALAVTTNNNPSTSSNLNTSSTATSCNKEPKDPKKNAEDRHMAFCTALMNARCHDLRGPQNQNTPFSTAFHKPEKHGRQRNRFLSLLSSISKEIKTGSNTSFSTSKSDIGYGRQRNQFPSSSSSSSQIKPAVSNGNNNNQNKKPIREVLEETKLLVESKVWNSDVEKISPLMGSFRRIVKHLDVLLQPKVEYGVLSLIITSYVKNSHVFKAKRLLENEIRQRCSNMPRPFNRNNNYRT